MWEGSSVDGLRCGEDASRGRHFLGEVQGVVAWGNCGVGALLCGIVVV